MTLGRDGDDQLEVERLRAVMRLQLGPSSDSVLDRLAQVVQEKLGVPVSLVSLIEADRQVFAGLAGLQGWAGQARATPLSHSFCQHVVTRRGPVVIDDAANDPLVQDNLAIKDLGVASYLGMPVTDASDRVLGSLCAIGATPRVWTVGEIDILRELAAVVSDELRSRVDTDEITAPTPAEVAWRAEAGERHLKALINGLPVMMGYWDRDLRTVIVNDAFLKGFGKQLTQVVGRHLKDITGQTTYERDRPFLEQALRGVRQEFNRSVTNSDGSVRHYGITYVPDVNVSGETDGIFVQIADVTTLTESVGFRDSVLTASPDVINVLRAGSDELVWSSRPGPARTATQDLGTDAVVESARIVIHPDDQHLVTAATAAVRDVPDGEFLAFRCREQRSDGSWGWTYRRMTPFARDERGAVLQVLALYRDIQETVELTERLEQAAVRDHLTGLPNRRLLNDRLESALRRQSQTGRLVPVLYCDLDGFKRINDTGGHQAGDRVLIETARRMKATVRPCDTVARVGGDEFVVVLEPDAVAPSDVESHFSTRGAHAFALLAAERLGTALREVIHVDGRDHYVTASIGVALARHGEHAEHVIHNADAAMYRAKSMGKARSEVFDPAMHAGADAYRHTEATLREGLSTNPIGTSIDRDSAAIPAHRPQRIPPAALSVAYQPIYDLRDMRIVGVEALARLTDSDGRMIPPSVFIPVAEEAGLIPRLGSAVLNTACSDLAAWRESTGRTDLRVSVNLSARQVGGPDLVDAVLDTLNRNGLPAQALILELTESVLLEAGRTTISAIRSLRDQGMGFAIDDFGTGYASLRYLAELPVTSVKVDRSFTGGLPHDRVSASIVRAVVGIADDLGIDCVVEGIETREQLNAIPPTVHGQGYLLARPAGAAHIMQLLTGCRHNKPDQA